MMFNTLLSVEVTGYEGVGEMGCDLQQRYPVGQNEEVGFTVSILTPGLPENPQDTDSNGQT